MRSTIYQRTTQRLKTQVRAFCALGVPADANLYFGVICMSIHATPTSLHALDITPINLQHWFTIILLSYPMIVGEIHWHIILFNW